MNLLGMDKKNKKKPTVEIREQRKKYHINNIKINGFSHIKINMFCC